MRVLVLAPGYPLDGDVFGHAVKEQVASLSALHDVRVQSLVRLSIARSTSRGVDVYSGSGGRARRVVTMVARHAPWRPDVIWSLWADSALGVLLGRILRRPVMVSVMGGEVASLSALGYGGARSRSGRLRLQAVLRAARVVTVGSRSLAARVAAVVPSVQPIEAPIGVRPEEVPVRVRGPWCEGPLRLGTVINADPVKGGTHVLRALSWLRARGVPAELTVFTLAPEDKRQQLLAMAGAANVLEWTRVAPPIPAPELYRRLPELDVLVSASAHEAQGLSMIEAALAEVPVVAPDVGVARELAEIGALHLAPALTPEVLGSAVLEAAARSTQARDRVSARFGLTECTARFDRALRRAAG